MIGIGLDAVDVARFRAVIGRRPAILDRCFTPAERSHCARRSDPTPGLAARFAAKEAAMKALGVGIGAVAFTELEVATASSGAPSLVVHGRAEVLARSLGVRALHVTLTHTDVLAGAVVVAE